MEYIKLTPTNKHENSYLKDWNVGRLHVLVTRAHMYSFLLELLELEEILKLISSHLLLQMRGIQMVNNSPKSLYNQDLHYSFCLKRDIGTMRRLDFCTRSSLHQTRGERFKQLSQLLWQMFTELPTRHGTLTWFRLHWGQLVVAPPWRILLPCGYLISALTRHYEARSPACAQDCVPHEHFRQIPEPSTMMGGCLDTSSFPWWHIRP